jgi:hypothetical protein
MTKLSRAAKTAQEIPTGNPGKGISVREISA